MLILLRYNPKKIEPRFYRPTSKETKKDIEEEKKSNENSDETQGSQNGTSPKVSEREAKFREELLHRIIDTQKVIYPSDY